MDVSHEGKNRVNLTSFAQIALLLAVAAAVGALAVRLRQPLMVAFILVGVLVGPSVLGWVHAQDEIDLLAQIGVAVLLFVVGLRLDLKLVRHLGPVALATGIGQIAFTTVFGLGLALLLGLAWTEAVYVAVALTFSSTIIVVKLLSDKREIDSLHGRIALGFLIVQDIAVVIAMMVVGSWNGLEGVGRSAAAIGVRLLGAALAIAILMRYVLPPVLHVLARSQELLVLFAIAWGVALAALGEGFGFGREVGAFAAGFSLASSAFREALSTRLVSIRDFLLVFFFIDLGAKLEPKALGADLGTGVALSLFVLLGNPLIVMAIMGRMGYRKRTSFLAGLTVAQVSEFSVVFVAMGITLGHVNASVLGLVTFVGLVTITLSTYMILYSEPLYRSVEPFLGVFERTRPIREMGVEASADATAPQVVVFGLGRYGSRLLADLVGRGVRATGIDFDPEVVRTLRERGLDARFGDAEDLSLLGLLPLEEVRWIVSTLPRPEVNRALLHTLAAHRFTGSTAVTVHHDRDAAELTRAGARQVLFPYRDAADRAAAIVAEGLAGG